MLVREKVRHKYEKPSPCVFWMTKCFEEYDIQISWSDLFSCIQLFQCLYLEKNTYRPISLAKGIEIMNEQEWQRDTDKLKEKQMKTHRKRTIDMILKKENRIWKIKEKGI